MLEFHYITTKKIILPILLLVTLFLSSCFALSEPEESSGAVAAPTLAADDQPQEAPAVQEEQEQPAPQPTQEAAVEEAAPVEEVQPVDDAYPPPLAPAQDANPDNAYPAGEDAPAPEQEQPPADYPAPDTAADAAVYEIDPARSEARGTPHIRCSDPRAM